MSNYVLPTFAGLDVEVERGSSFRTTVYTTISNKEQRVNWGPARREFTLKFNVLRENVYLTTGSFSGSTEIGALVSLHNAVSGSFDSWLMDDPYGGAQVRVRFVEDSLSITRVVPGIWEAEARAIEVL